MTIESMVEVLRAHLRARGLSLTTGSGALDGIEEAIALREIAELMSDADTTVPNDEPTRVMSNETLANLRAACAIATETNARWNQDRAQRLTDALNEGNRLRAEVERLRAGRDLEQVAGGK